MKGEEVNRADVAASFQQSVTDVLTEHTVGAAKRLGINKVAIAGGVASNSSLRAQMEEACRKNGIEFYHPSPIFCTDNAADDRCGRIFMSISKVFVMAGT